MKKALGLLLLATNLFAAGVPSQITYQGTLKESGVPVSATRNMSFRITNSNGTSVYWSSGNMSIAVNQGLFSVPLSPNGVDWQNIVPYMEVSVEGQLLLPREALTSNVYSLVAGTVVDGAITQAKLDPSIQNVLTPAGAVVAFAGAAAPTGWLLCDGSAVSRTTYANLFQAIGVTWGGGNGVSTFNLPDLRGRTTIGAGQGTSLTNRTLGQTLGEETHTLTANEMPSHSHGVTDPGHSHLDGWSVALAVNVGPNGPFLQSGNRPAPPDHSTGSSGTNISIQNSGGNGAHNVMQPSAAMNFIIKH